MSHSMTFAAFRWLGSVCQLPSQLYCSFCTVSITASLLSPDLANAYASSAAPSQLPAHALGNLLGEVLRLFRVQAPC